MNNTIQKKSVREIGKLLSKNMKEILFMEKEAEEKFEENYRFDACTGNYEYIGDMDEENKLNDTVHQQIINDIIEALEEK